MKCVNDHNEMYSEHARLITTFNKNEKACAPGTSWDGSGPGPGPGPGPGGRELSFSSPPPEPNASLLSRAVPSVLRKKPRYPVRAYTSPVDPVTSLALK